MKCLLNYLAEKGKSQRQLADMLGVSESTISRILQGKRTMKVDLVNLCSKKTGIPVETIMKDLAKARSAA